MMELICTSNLQHLCLTVPFTHLQYVPFTIGSEDCVISIAFIHFPMCFFYSLCIVC